MSGCANDNVGALIGPERVFIAIKPEGFIPLDHNNGSLSSSLLLPV
jgi:hypothetical protein